MRYFDALRTVEEIKKEFRRLIMLHHPDHGGSTATTQEIISQYHTALQRADGQTTKDSEDKPHTYHYNAATEQEIIDKIDELIAAGVTRSCEIWLIGTWVWIQGETKPIRHLLQSHGCTYHGKRQCWYWQNGPERHRYNSKADLNDLAAKYGASKFRDKKEEKITA